MPEVIGAGCGMLLFAAAHLRAREQARVASLGGGDAEEASNPVARPCSTSARSENTLPKQLDALEQSSVALEQQLRAVRVSLVRHGDSTASRSR